MSKLYAEVAIGLSVDDPFTYEIAGNEKDIVGCRVLVNFNGKERIGYVVAVKRDLGGLSYKLKPVLNVIDETPILSDELLNLAGWISDYYVSSLGEAIENMLPKILKLRKNPYDKIKFRKTSEDNVPSFHVAPNIHELTFEQKKAFYEIKKGILSRKYNRYLLYGVTGSGKTEVYIRAIKEVLNNGGGVICLFPEIALTNHLLEYFYAHFENEIALYHSKLSDVDRYKAWLDIKRGRKKVIIGPRSALFAPFKNLKLVIIDEEHENTYKQNETPRYDARAVARKRCELNDALLIEGGATPSLESVYAVMKSESILIEMKNRVDNKPMPRIDVVDMRYEVKSGKSMTISKILVRAIEDAIGNGDGVILFMNRRGFSTSISCLKCGEYMKCPNCSVSLTYHKSMNKFLCHYCDYSSDVIEICPFCGSSYLIYGGVGTEKIEDKIKKIFPKIRIGRVDTDVARKKGEYEKVLKAFKSRKLDILVGTQMITKGFNFNHVTLVGIINADSNLMLPDFRSAERTFNLITQVAGRAGRGIKEGRVIIQTYLPEHYAIKSAANNDFKAFVRSEISSRKKLFYPPFSKIINIIGRAKSEKRLIEFMNNLIGAVKTLFAGENVEFLGPAPLPFFYMKEYYRWHIMIKGIFPESKHKVVKKELDKLKNFMKMRDVKYVVDVDPSNIL